MKDKNGKNNEEKRNERKRVKEGGWIKENN